MTAIGRPDNALIAPNCFGHRDRHDGVVARRQGKHRAIELVLSLSRVPVHQPIEPFVEPCGIERVWPGEASGAARAPKRLERSARIPLESTFKRRQARRRDMARKTVEALHADKGLVVAATILEQPEEPK